ncbi:MAG: Dabb family protein [Betaproteobacteria bacterium]
MFVHLVLIKLKPGIARNDPRVQPWRQAFAALEHQCRGIVRMEHGWNTTERPIAYDYGINMAFATRADLDAYGPDPAHQAVVAKLREIAEWIICDYEATDAKAEDAR